MSHFNQALSSRDTCSGKEIPGSLIRKKKSPVQGRKKKRVFRRFQFRDRSKKNRGEIEKSQWSWFANKWECVTRTPPKGVFRDRNVPHALGVGVESEMKKKRLKQVLGSLAVMGACLFQMAQLKAQPDQRSFPNQVDGQFLAGIR